MNVLFTIIFFLFSFEISMLFDSFNFNLYSNLKFYENSLKTFLHFFSYHQIYLIFCENLLWKVDKLLFQQFFSKFHLFKLSNINFDCYKFYLFFFYIINELRYFTFFWSINFYVFTKKLNQYLFYSFYFVLFFLILQKI